GLIEICSREKSWHCGTQRKAHECQIGECSILQPTSLPFFAISNSATVSGGVSSSTRTQPVFCGVRLCPQQVHRIDSIWRHYEPLDSLGCAALLVRRGRAVLPEEADGR